MFLLSLRCVLFTAIIQLVISSTPKYYIPGRGCGLLNEWKKMESLPEDLEELQSLQCVFTNDLKGIQRWKQTQKSWKWTSDWSECSKTCGEGGITVRMRECRNGTHTLELSEYNLESNNVTMTCGHSVECLPCTLFDTVYQGGDEIETLSEVPSIGLCQEPCKTHSECEFWSFNQLEQTCQLLRTEGTKLDYDEGILSGPKHCNPDGEQSCFYHHTSILGNEVKVQKTGNIITCQDICMESEQCQFWTYLYDQKRCRLHNSITGGLDEDNSVAISGSKNCKPLHTHKTNCLQFGFNPSVDTFIDHPGKTIFDCPGLCESESTCNSWQYSFASSKCFTFTLEDSSYQLQGWVITTYGLCKSGVEGNCVDFHTDVAGGSTQYDISTIQESDPMTCQRLCQANAECEYWYLSGNIQACILRRSIPSNELEYNPTTKGFTGTKDCVPSSLLNLDCLELNVDYYSNDLLITDALTIPQCQSLCESKPGCVGYTYLYPTCYLKDSLAGHSVLRSGISGQPNSCPSPFYDKVRP